MRIHTHTHMIVQMVATKVQIKCAVPFRFFDLIYFQFMCVRLFRLKYSFISTIFQSLCPKAMNLMFFLRLQFDLYDSLVASAHTYTIHLKDTKNTIVTIVFIESGLALHPAISSDVYVICEHKSNEMFYKLHLWYLWSVLLVFVYVWPFLVQKSF